MFLNSILAFGALAFTVPLAIHLFFRSRFQTVDWGAMHLIDSVVRINRRRIQWMHLLLLLLRCLIPILFAFALARPVLNALTSSGSGEPKTVIIAIDDSRSMAVRDDSGNSRFLSVRNDLVSLISDLHRRDSVVLIPASETQRPADTLSPAAAIDRLRQLRPTAGTASIAQMATAAVESSNASETLVRQIILVSDFQAQDVNDGALASLERVGQQIELASSRPTVSFWNVGDGSQELRNVYVETVLVDSPAVIAGRRFRMTARIRNASDDPVSNVRLTWKQDGHPVDYKTVSIDARSAATVAFATECDTPEVEVFSVEIDVPDALHEDNVRALAVDVSRGVDVVVLDGDPSQSPMESESDFLSLALSPFAFGGGNQSDAVRTSVLTRRDFRQRFNAQACDVLVLANVEKIDEEMRSQIADFVFAGGGLVLFDGDSVKPEEYNVPWKVSSVRGDQSSGGSLAELRLPGDLGEVMGDANHGARRGVFQAERPSSTMQIGLLNNQFKPWRMLGRGNNEQVFSGVDLYAYRRLNVTESDTPVIKLLSVAGGGPLVLQRSFGRGTVTQFAIPCDDDWSTMPTDYGFLPLVQQLVLSVGGDQSEVTVDVGQPMTFAGFDSLRDRSGGKTIEPNVVGPHRVTVQTPSRGDRTLMTDRHGGFVFDGVKEPGVYRFRGDISKTETPSESVGETELPPIAMTRVATIPASESVLSDASFERVSAAADSVSAVVYGDLDSLRVGTEQQTFGREMWRWALAAVLFLLFVEIYVAGRSVAGAKSKAEHRDSDRSRRRPIPRRRKGVA